MQLVIHPWGSFSRAPSFETTLAMMQKQTPAAGLLSVTESPRTLAQSNAAGAKTFPCVRKAQWSCKCFRSSQFPVRSDKSSFVNLAGVSSIGQTLSTLPL